MMNLTINATDTTLDEMFQRMGKLLTDIATTKTGLGDEIAQSEHSKGSQPGVGEVLDLTA